LDSVFGRSQPRLQFSNLRNETVPSLETLLPKISLSRNPRNHLMTNSAQSVVPQWKTIRSLKEKRDDLYFDFELSPRPGVELREVHEALSRCLERFPCQPIPSAHGVSNRVPEGEANAAGVVGDCSGAGRRGRVVL
jgi:hypothetical protein